MKPGIDFVDQLQSHLSGSDVLLAIIGPDWLSAKDSKGQQRIGSEDDYVRLEIKSALERNIPVIPILVDSTVMPAANDLPIDLRPLTRRHALELRNTRFAVDARSIAVGLEGVLQEPPHPRRYFFGLIALGLVVLLAAAIAYWFFYVSKPQPGTANARPCEEENQLRSSRTSPPTQIAFRNNSPGIRRVYWIDYDGRRVPHLTLQKDEFNTIQTYTTHPWLVSDENDKCIAIYMPSATPTQVLIDR